MTDDVISLDTVPVNLRDPGSYIEFNNTQAQGPLPNLPRRKVIFGQHTSASQVGAGVLTRLLGKDDGKKYWGRGSQIASMVEAAFLADNSNSTETYGIALDDNGSGVAAVWHLTSNGAATAAGSATLYVGGPGLAGVSGCGAVSIAIASGMSAAAQATAWVAAIAADPDLPVTAAVDGTVAAQVNITCRWKGVSGNDLDLRTHYYKGDQPPAGCSYTIAVATAGTLNPVLTGAITAMGTKWFTDVVMPYTDATSLAAIGAEMERRWGSTVQQDGMVYSFSALSVGSLATLGSGLNEKLQSVVGFPVCPTPSWIAASVIGSVAAYYLQIDPAAPLDSSIGLPGIAAPASSDQLQHPDREALLHDGIATLGVDSGGNVVFGRMITTYQTNGAGFPDDSYLDVETMALLAYLRYWTRARIASKWPRYKLANDPVNGQSLPRGVKVTCPKLVKADLVAGTNDLYKAGLVDNPDAFAKAIQAVRDTNDEDRINAKMPWTLIGRFRVFAGQINFLQ